MLAKINIMVYNEYEQLTPIDIFLRKNNGLYAQSAARRAVKYVFASFCASILVIFHVKTLRA